MYIFDTVIILVNKFITLPYGSKASNMAVYTLK
jgi:hypothetical protein